MNEKKGNSSISIKLYDQKEGKRDLSLKVDFDVVRKVWHSPLIDFAKKNGEEYLQEKHIKA